MGSLSDIGTDEGESRRLASHPHRRQFPERLELVLQVFLRDAAADFRAADVDLGHGS